MHESMLSHVNNLANLIPMKTVDLSLSHNNRGVRGPGTLFSCHMQVGHSGMGNVFYNKEKGLSVVSHKASRHVLARCPTPRIHRRSQFLPTATTTFAMSVPMVSAEHLKPNNLIQGDARPIWRRTKGHAAACRSFCQRKDGMFIQSTCCVLHIQKQNSWLHFCERAQPNDTTTGELECRFNV